MILPTPKCFMIFQVTSLKHTNIYIIFISLPQKKNPAPLLPIFLPLNLLAHVFRCGISLRMMGKGVMGTGVQEEIREFSGHRCLRWLKLSGRGVEVEGVNISFCGSSTAWFTWNKVWRSSYHPQLKYSHHKVKVQEAHVVRQDCFNLHLPSWLSWPGLKNRLFLKAEEFLEVDRHEAEPEFPRLNIHYMWVVFF